VPPPEPPVDYQLLLLSLAEEYIKAAHGIGSLVALYRRAEDTSQYYKLIATGLGCMESALIVRIPDTLCWLIFLLMVIEFPTSAPT
jgi:hypothetical protein